MSREDLFEKEIAEERSAIESANKLVTNEYVEADKMKQGSKAWFHARMGKFTGSKLPDLMKRGRAKTDTWGKTAIDVVRKVAIERDLTELGAQLYVDEMFSKNFRQTEWGNKHEDEAVERYMQETGFHVDRTSFKTHPHISFMGGSFDGELPTENGIIEVKCPYDVLKHQENVELEVISEKHTYYEQIQGNMEIAGVDFCDFISYDPRRKNDSIKIIRVQRDQELIDRLLDRIKIGEQAVEYITMGIEAEAAVCLAEKEYYENKD